MIELLESKGHEVIPFSVRYSKNLHSKYDNYFVSALSSEKEVYFKDHSWTASSFKKTLQRAFYSSEVYRSLIALIKETKPDAAVVLHYLRKLSPAVLTALADNRIPFVVRLSDYAMICPNAYLLRDIVVCQLCVGKSMLPSIKYRCVQGSLGASVVNYAATQYHLAKGYFDLIPHFITPSKFLRSKMIEGGWDEKRLVHIPTFVQPQHFNFDENRKRQIVYAGRLEKIKGVQILLKAISILKNDKPQKPFDMIIVGDGDPVYVAELKGFVTAHNLENVHFIGNVSKEKVLEILKNSFISIVPSILYENTPNTVLESFACGTPVIASNHGSFPELVMEGKTGFLFEPGNANDLAKKIINVVDHQELCLAMSKNAMEFIAMNHSPNNHYKQLMALLTSLQGR
ncbi:MAG: glycosyltransferase family 4 protein [Bacteroidota bacterium]